MFWSWTTYSLGTAGFTQIGVVGEYAKRYGRNWRKRGKVCAYSPYTLIALPRNRRIRRYPFPVFGEYAEILSAYSYFLPVRGKDFCVFSSYAESISAYSPNTWKGDMRLLQIRRKDMNVFSEYADIYKSCPISSLGVQKPKIFQILSHFHLLVGFSQKTISRYCPFKGTVA